METPNEFYDRMLADAKLKGRKFPPQRPEEGPPMAGWINYWRAMDEHDRRVAGGDKNPGRPVVPHRSGR